MITTTLFAAFALARIQTLPAYGEYLAAVDICAPPARWSSAQLRDLRAAFIQTNPDRHVTVSVELQIASDTRDMRTCLDDVAAQVEASAAAKVDAFGQAGAAPWLADIAKRKDRAEKEVRAYFVEAGYRRSNASPKPSPGFFYCQIEYRDPADDPGRRGMLQARFVSRIMPDPSLRSDADADTTTKVQARFLRDFRTWVNANHIIRGVRPSAFQAEPACFSRPSFAALRDLRGDTPTPGIAFGD